MESANREMNNKETQVFKTFIELDHTKANQAKDEIKSTVLKPIAEAFHASLENIGFLLITPQILLSHGYGQAASFSYYFSLAKVDEFKGALTFDKWYAMVKDKVKQVSKTEEARDSFIEHLKKFADEQLSELVKDKWVASSIHSIYSAALVSGWTTFECAAADSWEVALNDRPIELGHPAFKGISDHNDSYPGLSSKLIPVGLLAKFGFNLTSSLGTVLKTRYDFTSVTGIRQAFLAAFGKNEVLENILNDSRLSHLEATRHLIVHRAGIIDEEFIRRTKTTSAKGKLITHTNSLMLELLNAVVEAGSELLLAVDRKLCTQIS